MIKEPRLLDCLRDRIRLKHYSIRTEKAYLDWNRRFILFHNKKHPRNMGAPAVEQFLTYLGVLRPALKIRLLAQYFSCTKKC